MSDTTPNIFEAAADISPREIKIYPKFVYLRLMDAFSAALDDPDDKSLFSVEDPTFLWALLMLRHGEGVLEPIILPEQGPFPAQEPDRPALPSVSIPEKVNPRTTKSRRKGKTKAEPDSQIAITWSSDGDNNYADDTLESSLQHSVPQPIANTNLNAGGSNAAPGLDKFRTHQMSEPIQLRPRASTLTKIWDLNIWEGTLVQRLSQQLQTLPPAVSSSLPSRDVHDEQEDVARTVDDPENLIALQAITLKFDGRNI
ncbi:hypothetical protein B0H19DRAFT_1059831 [Mycena capillaripes]|nr:hypothetical protein B0H19DRAFT_1059831 [Mycena capillaripes]